MSIFSNILFYFANFPLGLPPSAPITTPFQPYLRNRLDGTKIIQRRMKIYYTSELVQQLLTNDERICLKNANEELAKLRREKESKK
jgi:hypothetical protein